MKLEQGSRSYWVIFACALALWNSGRSARAAEQSTWPRSWPEPRSTDAAGNLRELTDEIGGRVPGRQQWNAQFGGASEFQAAAADEVPRSFHHPARWVRGQLASLRSLRPIEEREKFFITIASDSARVYSACLSLGWGPAAQRFRGRDRHVERVRMTIPHGRQLRGKAVPS